MITLDEIIDYVKDNGEYSDGYFNYEWKLKLENGYWIEYILPVNSTVSGFINVHKKGFGKNFNNGYLIRDLEVQLNKFDTIYEVIDYYEIEDIKERVAREEHYGKLEKFLGR